MKEFIKVFLFTSVFLLLYSCSGKRYTYPVWIDEIPQGQVINYYGSPEINKSFGGDSIRITGKTYERGLGTHAPSDLKIQIDKRDLIFDAIIGIDSKIKDYRDTSARRLIKNFPSYIYDGNEDIRNFNQGGTAVFKVYANNKLVYESPLLNENSRPVKVRLKVRDAQNIRLVTEPYKDGSFADHTNWAMARLTFIEDTHPSSLLINSTPDEIMHNQAGYKPGAYKKCVMPADIIDSLYIFNYHTNELVYKNTINLISEDMGKYLIADFSEFKEPGSYYLSSAGRKSGKFDISDTILTNHLYSYLNFIKTIRKNNKGLGQPWNTDKRRERNETEHKLPERGYDGYAFNSSLSKSIQVLYALSVLKEFNKHDKTDSLVMEEIEYGNRFLQSMQEPGGCLMSFEDVDHYGYNENQIKDDSILRSLNNRSIVKAPASIYNQFKFSMVQARLAKLLRNDLNDAQTCLNSAKTSFRWATLNVSEKDAGILGTAIGAACELHNVNNNSYYKKVSTEFATELLQLFDSTNLIPFGLFKTFFTDSLSFIEKEGDPSVWPIAGLCLYVKSFPEDRLVEECKKVINYYCTNVLRAISKNNAFDLIPCALYDHYIEGSKSKDDYFYRLFCHDIKNRQPGNGTISHIASAAAGLVMASEILNKPELHYIAQRQLDWALGCNPFNMSFVTDIGYRHTVLYKPPGFPEPDPGLPGGVMRGISADINDTPALYPGWKQTSEYYIDAVANIMWLTTLLDR